MEDIIFYVFGSIFTAISLLVGLILKIYPPKNINIFYGMRTKTTAQCQKTWDYAHKLCANTLLVYSIFPIIVFVIFCVVNPNFISEAKHLLVVIGLVLAILGVLITTIVVEVKTRKYAKTLDIKEFQQNEFVEL